MIGRRDDPHATAPTLEAPEAPAVTSAGPGDATLDPTLPGTPLSRVGHFVLLERLGAGGMGVVYAAFDDQLERKVAIKLVASRAGDPARLLREAQAQAQLSHPNVVTVYEVGSLPDGQLFIAMELVKGQTLRAWQDTGKRRWQDVVAVYAAAGNGLAAAHRSRIVHRDFKPDNVLIGEDGRARVTDFGLAFAVESALAHGTPLPRPALDRAESRPPLATQASESGHIPGHIAGTPGYMAPEQLAGQPVDARTDQFAFCVALYEALHGERPPDELRGHSERPDRRRAGEAYPRWLWDVMVRGLAHAPDHRFASMDALLAELTRRRERARRRTIAISAAVCVLAIAGAMLTINPAAVPICPRVPDKLVGIWDAATKQRVHAALAGTGAPFADKVWAATAAAFDGYADRWLDAQQAACKATYVEHVQSADLLDRRTDCLEGRRRSFAATTEVLRDRPAQAVAHAGELVNSLAEIALCADASFLLELARHRPALPPGAQAQAAEIRVQLARARALMATEDLSGAEPVIARAAALARGPGDDPAHAEIDYLSAYVKMLRGSLPEALQLFDRAIEQAIAIRDDELAADVYLTLAMSAAERNLKPTEGRRWLQQAQAWLDRLGHASDPRAIQIKAARGYLQLADGDAGPAVVTLSSAIGDTEKRWGAQDPRLIVLLEGRASGHARIGERDAAVADGKRALELGLRTWGQDYPEVARTRRVLGMIYLEQFSDPQRGAAELTEALRIFRAQHDPESIEIANCEQGLSVAAQYRGDLAAVLEHAETAERIFAGRLGATNPRRAEALNGVAVARFLLRDYTGALAAYEAVYPIWSQAFGPGHPSVGLLLSNTGEALLALDRPSAAQRDFDQALAILKTALPADSPDLALPLKGLGLTRLRLGHPSEAIAPFEQALALRIRAGTIGEPAEVAEIQWGLARALRALGRDPVRAHKLALDALAGYRSLGAQLDWRAQEISQGLRSW